MYVRIATFEGADPAELRTALDAIGAAEGPPEGVDSHGITVFGTDSGKVFVIGRFESRDALERGDEVLSAMSPPAGSMGRRVSVDLAEVLLDRDAPAS